MMLHVECLDHQDLTVGPAASYCYFWVVSSVTFIHSTTIGGIVRWQVLSWTLEARRVGGVARWVGGDWSSDSQPGWAGSHLLELFKIQYSLPPSPDIHVEAGVARRFGDMCSEKISPRYISFFFLPSPTANTSTAQSLTPSTLFSQNHWNWWFLRELSLKVCGSFINIVLNICWVPTVYQALGVTGWLRPRRT